MENKEIENKGLTLQEFENMWVRGLENKRFFEGILDYNVIVDFSDTEIKADDYEIQKYDKDNEEYTLIYLYYKKLQIASIRLGKIKLVY
jgi:hypothetical protein